MADRVPDALRTAQEIFNDYGYCPEVVEEYCWLYRQAGEPEKALVAVNRGLGQGYFHRNYDPEFAYVLLVERARVHAALGKWPQAEKDLEEYFRLQGKHEAASYKRYAAACLLQGFLRDRQGGQEGTLAAWRR